jgi:hypothetical protein
MHDFLKHLIEPILVIEALYAFTVILIVLGLAYLIHWLITDWFNLEEPFE